MAEEMLLSAATVIRIEGILHTCVKVVDRSGHIIYYGTPDERINHNCDQMGCSSVAHVLRILGDGYKPTLAEKMGSLLYWGGK